MKKLSLITITGAALLLASTSFASVATQLSTKVVTSTVSVIGATGATGPAVSAMMADQTAIATQLGKSAGKHSFLQTNMNHIQRALKSVRDGNSAKGMTQQEATAGLATILLAAASLDDMPAILKVDSLGNVKMKNGKSFFASENTQLSDAQEKQLISGIVGLIQGGQLASGVLGQKINIDATRQGLKVLELFASNQSRGDIMAAYEAFTALNADNPADRAQQVARACSTH